MNRFVQKSTKDWKKAADVHILRSRKETKAMIDNQIPSDSFSNNPVIEND